MSTNAVRYARVASGLTGAYSAVTCPVHQQVVAVVDGKLVGRCDGCCREAAAGLQKLKRDAL